MTSNKIRVAVIGAGNMGRHHIRNYSLLPQCELVAVADVVESNKAIADEYDVPFFADAMTMITTVKPKAISIATPTPFHYHLAKFAIENGVHCLIEKPITSTVEQADELIKLAKERKVVLTVGHIEHYNPLVVKLKEVIDTGKVGEVTSIICRRVGGFPKVEPKTNVILDLAVHDAGIINHLLGSQPRNIYSHGSVTHHSKELDSAEILLDYGHASGIIQTNWLTPIKIRTIAVTGSKGFIEGNYITQELKVYKHNMQKKFDSQFSSFVTNMGEPEKDIIAVDFEEPLTVELRAFIARVEGDASVYLVEPELAKSALETVLQATRGIERQHDKD